MRALFILVLVALLLTIACSDGSDTPSSPTNTPEPTQTPIPSPTLPAVETPTPIPEPTPSESMAVIEEISPNPAYLGDTVNFKGKGSDVPGQITEFKWSVEGHGPIAFRSVFKTSAITGEAGIYAVVFEVRDKDGDWLEPATQILTVLPHPPAAIFSGEPISGGAPLTVKFDDKSTRTISSWAWDFGDGGTSEVQSPLHTYTEAGNYTVSLTVDGPDGSDTESVEDYIQVVEVDFSADYASGYHPLDVQFTDQSKGDIVSWAWHFGDGGMSEEQSPSHTYQDVGVYPVSLTVTGQLGAIATEEKTAYIQVLEAPPVADFFGHEETYVGHTETFTDHSTGEITSWTWNFGDGTVSEVRNPSHAYGATGTYSVSLTVESPGGSDTKKQTITVEEWE
ncbi:MAG: PKD domain-containing protein [Chloroflexi bacterium]|nr:PKD domain-containing protein [Chloroflexota bacterium]